MLKILQLVQDFLDELDDNTSLPHINIEVKELSLNDVKFGENGIAQTNVGGIYQRSHQVQVDEKILPEPFVRSNTGRGE